MNPSSIADYKINYDGRTFVPIANSESGEVSSDTFFRYHQNNDLFWAEYAGGDIRKGFMIGLVQRDGRLTFSYQHLNRDGALRSGLCSSTPEKLPDGRIRLHEKWQWNDQSKESGQSIVEEII